MIAFAVLAWRDRRTRKGEDVVMTEAIAGARAAFAAAGATHKDGRTADAWTDDEVIAMTRTMIRAMAAIATTFRVELERVATAVHDLHAVLDEHDLLEL